MKNATEMFAEVSRVRAKPLAADDRRAAIVDAVIPLLIEHGRGVTTRQIAEAADVAEGTIFRVFADKDAIFAAAVDKFLDPTETNRAVRAIDPESSLEGKVNDILFLARSRLQGIFGILNAVGMSGPPPHRPEVERFEDLIAEVLAPDLDRLHASPERIGSFIRLVAFATSIPHFNVGHEIPTAELARLITYGIAGTPAEGEADAS